MKLFVRLGARWSRVSRACRLLAGAALLAAVLPGASRAATIPIDPMTLSGVAALGNEEWVPTVLDDDFGVKKLTWLQPGSWAEFPVTIPAGEGGVYSFTAKYGTPNPPAGDLGLPVALSVDIRLAGTEQHIGSEDVVLPATGTDDSAYQPTAPITIPGYILAPGDYVVRLRHVGMLHTLAGNRSAGYQWRNELSAAAKRRVDIGDMALTSTGPLPATGTISGTVSSSDLASTVIGAYVMAVPAGKEIGEPGPFWTSGHWTLSGPYGNFELSVPPGTYTVQVGRPDCYETAGARKENVSVTAGVTTTADIALKSRWTSVDGAGALLVEEEYFHAKTPDALPDLTWNTAFTNGTAMVLNADGNASNQFKISWTGSGNYVDVYVDVPVGKAGDYDVFCSYNSYSGATVQFIANPGETDESISEDTLPNSSNDPVNEPWNGYWMSKTVKLLNPIKLRAGRNVVREIIVSGGADFDAFRIEASIPDVPIPGVADPRKANFVWAIGEKEPGGQIAFPEKVGNSITNLYRGNYVEIPMTFDATGIYKAVVKTKAWGTAPLIQLDLRPAASDDHFATGDVPVPAVSGADSETTILDIPVLQTGDYVLRVRNNTMFHTTVATRGDFNAYATGTFAPNRMDFGQTVFTKTGALPAAATISGSVKALDLGNVGVGKAQVMANPAGAGVPEPSVFWYKGFWTNTDDSGNYSMPVVAGTYDVQAGQTAMYAYAGANAPATVAAGGTATVNLPLVSRATQDAGNHLEIMVEVEYFFDKVRDSWGPGYPAAAVGFQHEGVAQNQLKVGYTDGGDYVDLAVEVPAAGQYTVTDYYFNGYWDGVSRPDGTVSLTANPGAAEESKTQGVQPCTAPAGANPNQGYSTPGTKVFDGPVTLKAGHNVLRLKLESGSSAFDAVKLTSVAIFPPRASALSALKIAGGLETAAPNALTNLDADQDGRITLLDAVKLAKQGLL